MYLIQYFLYGCYCCRLHGRAACRGIAGWEDISLRFSKNYGTLLLNNGEGGKEIQIFGLRSASVVTGPEWRFKEIGEDFVTL